MFKRFNENTEEDLETEQKKTKYNTMAIGFSILAAAYFAFWVKGLMALSNFNDMNSDHFFGGFISLFFAATAYINRLAYVRTLEWQKIQEKKDFFKDKLMNHKFKK